MTMGVPGRFAAFLSLSACVLGMPACSGAAAGNFAVDAAAPHDASTAEEASSPEMDATSPTIDVVARGDEGSPVTDSIAPREASAAIDSGDSSEAGGDEGGTSSLCAKICMGCCDALGKCRPGNTMAVCGATGGACEDCSTHQCTTLTESPCCGANGCGCAVAGILGCH